MDTVYLQGLETDAVIGVHDWERGIRQTLVIDLEMGVDAALAAKHDALTDALDYDAVAGRVTAFVTASEFQLIESVAEGIAQILLSEFGIPWLRLQVSKPGAVAAARNTGVSIERGTRS